MIELWKFLTRDKLDAFVAVLEANDITHEVLSKGSRDTSNAGITLAVEEGDYERAKRLLMKHRRRKKSSDLK